MLYLWHDFYNTAFKIKHILYIASGSAPAAEKEKSGVRPGPLLILIIFCSVTKNPEIKSLPSELHGRHDRHCPNHTTRRVWTKISSAQTFSVSGHHILLNISYILNLQSYPQTTRLRSPKHTKQNDRITALARTHTHTYKHYRTKTDGKSVLILLSLLGENTDITYSCAVRTKEPCMSWHLEISKSDGDTSYYVLPS
jgi:hypothetical protein